MVDAPSSDDLPLLPADAAPVQPPIPVQQHQHAADNPPPSDDGLPMAPVVKPPILSSSWLQAGRQLWDEGTRGALLGTRAAAEGLGGVVGAVGDVLTYPGRAAMKAIGYQPPDQFPWMKDLTTAPSQQVQSTINQTGLPTPETPTEANVSTLVRVATPAVLGATNPAATLPGLIRTTTAAGTGGLAGEKVAQSDLIPPYLKPSVNLLVSMLVAKGVDVAGGVGAKAANAVAGNTSDIYNAFQRLQIDPRLVGTVSGSEAGQSAEAAMSRVPFASSIIRPVQQNTVNQFGDAVDRTALQLDPNRSAVTAQTTGENVQAAARNWKDTIFPQQQAQAWKPLNQRLAGTAVTPDGYRNALDSVTTQLSLPETQRVLTPGLAMQLRQALLRDVPGTGSMTWEQAQQLRSLIGQIMGVPEISQSVGADVLKRAYGGIAGDMRDTAVAHGQGNNFDAANQVSTDGHAFINGPLAKVISTNNPAQEKINPEQATNSLLNSGDTTLQAIRNNLPGAADQLAAYKLRTAATAKPSVGAYNDTSTGSFLTNVNRMRQNQPGGYGALYQDPQVQQQLNDLTTVAQQLRATEHHLNTSGTAEQLGWMEYLRGIGTAAAEGRPGKLAGAITIPPTVGIGGGRLMTSPAVTRFAAGRSGAPPPIPPSVAGLLGAVPQLTGQ